MVFFILMKNSTTALRLVLFMNRWNGALRILYKRIRLPPDPLTPKEGDTVPVMFLI